MLPLARRQLTGAFFQVSPASRNRPVTGRDDSRTCTHECVRYGIFIEEQF
jgi:hypothetical protein